MNKHRLIRADYNRETIVIYQAYHERIAIPAVNAQRFVAPFSWNRMTWIKPSFLWLMARSGWASKPGQECILAIRLRRSGWDRALSLATLTSFEPGVHADSERWREECEQAPVHVQWDPERCIDRRKLEQRSIQVGLGRAVIELTPTSG